MPRQRQASPSETRSDVFEVDHFRDHRIMKGKSGNKIEHLEFLTCWKGYPDPNEDTWQEYGSLTEAKNALKQYVAKIGGFSFDTAKKVRSRSRSRSLDDDRDDAPPSRKQRIDPVSSSSRKKPPSSRSTPAKHSHDSSKRKKPRPSLEDASMEGYLAEEITAQSDEGDDAIVAATYQMPKPRNGAGPASTVQGRKSLPTPPSSKMNGKKGVHAANAQKDDQGRDEEDEWAECQRNLDKIIHRHRNDFSWEGYIESIDGVENMGGPHHQDLKFLIRWKSKEAIGDGYVEGDILRQKAPQHIIAFYERTQSEVAHKEVIRMYYEQARGHEGGNTVYEFRSQEAVPITVPRSDAPADHPPGRGHRIDTVFLSDGCVWLCAGRRSPTRPCVISRLLAERGEPVNSIYPQVNGNAVVADMNSLDASTSKLSLEDSHAVRGPGGKAPMTIATYAAFLRDLDLDISGANILIFEIQELRHTANAVGTDVASSEHLDTAFEIDDALTRLDTRIEAIATAMAMVQTHKGIATDDTEREGSLQRIQDEWQRLQADAELLRDELKEQKWQSNFRRAGAEADDIMQSLDKVLSTCMAFIWHTQRPRHGSTSSTSSTDVFGHLGGSRTSSASHGHAAGSTESPETLLTEWEGHLRALEAKRKYYMPTTEYVMAALDKAVAGRKIRDDEVHRQCAELKARWTEVQMRMVRVERDMERNGQWLRDQVAQRPITSATPERPPPSHSARSPSNSSSSPYHSPPGRIAALPSPTQRQRTASKAIFADAAPHQPSQRPTQTPLSSRSHRDAGSPPRATSPLPRATPDKPRWSTSTKLSTEEAMLPRGARRASSAAMAQPHARPPRSRTPCSSSGRQTPSLLSARPSSPSEASSISSRSVSMGGLRPRPSSPSRIPMPGPVYGSNNGDSDEDLPTSLMQRALSPTPADVRHRGVSTVIRDKPRTSLTPVADRRNMANLRNMLQTPEPLLSAKANRIAGQYASLSPRSSRIATPTSKDHAKPMYSDAPRPSDAGYVPNLHDVLDVELAAIVNAQPVRARVVRVDPPLPKGAKLEPGESVQYSFSGSKPLQVKLVERTRDRATLRKVMVRVGGAWQDLEMMLVS